MADNGTVDDEVERVTHGGRATGAVPTAEVTYEVTGEGTVEISYLARSESGTATAEKGVTLPWKGAVRVPVGQGGRP